MLFGHYSALPRAEFAFFFKLPLISEVLEDCAMREKLKKFLKVMQRTMLQHYFFKRWILDLKLLNLYFIPPY